jgi:uncharacterized protein YciI
MKYLLTYESVPDSGPLSEKHVEAHLAYLKEFSERGVLLLIGPLQEPSNGDGLAVFSSQEAADEFVAGDPFVIHGVISNPQIRAWKEVLMPEPTQAG